MTSKMNDRSFSETDPRVDLAFERTRLAAERTLMAWIRTSIALIGFGFSIYKFFDYLHVIPNNSRNTTTTHASRNLGLALIALSTLAMVGAVAEYVTTVRKLGHGSFRVSLAFLVGILMMILGVFAFLGVLLGKGPF